MPNLVLQWGHKEEMNKVLFQRNVEMMGSGDKLSIHTDPIWWSKNNNYEIYISHAVLNNVSNHFYKIKGKGVFDFDVCFCVSS